MKKRLTISSIVVLSVSFLSLIAASVAWFEPNTDVRMDDGVGSTAASYFESGDGKTKDTAYVISAPVHLYNLAWLQYLGQFNTQISPTYFRLKNNIDMSSFGSALPPIGTENEPFIGIFDGGGFTISNLTVSNDKSDLTKKPSTVGNVSGCSVVGFFGIVGDPVNLGVTKADGLDYSKLPATLSISNFYLENVAVKSTTTSTLIGVVAGYVNGTDGSVSNIGVKNGSIEVADKATGLNNTNAKTGYTYGSVVSKFSLIGDTEDTNWKSAYSSSGGSSDIGYGTSTDIKALHNSLIANNLNDGTTGKIQSKYILPFRHENTTLVNGTTTSSISVKTIGGNSLTLNPSEYYTYKASTKGNNLGYYVGELETYDMTGQLDYNADDFGVQSGSAYSLENAFLKTPPDDVLKYLKSNGSHLIKISSGYSSDLMVQCNYSYVENGQVGSYSGPLVLPSNGIWVSPKENGTFKFVFYNPGFSSGNSVGIVFHEFYRTTSGDYSSKIYSGCNQGSGLTYSCKYGYFEKSATVGCEYFISFYNSRSSVSPYIAYMDIGTDSGSGTTPEPTTYNLNNVRYVHVIPQTTATGETYIDILFKIATAGASTTGARIYFARQSATSLYYSPESSTNIKLEVFVATSDNVSYNQDAVWDNTASTT